MNKLRLIGIFLLVGCGCAVNSAERNNTGNALYNQADYDNAIYAYQAAQVAAPDGPEAYYNAGSAYSQAGDFDKAIDALKQVLKTSDPELMARTYYNLGNIYFGIRHFDDAVAAYQQALLLQPDDNDARHNLELSIKQLVVASPSPTLPLEDVAEKGGNEPTPTAESLGQDSATATLLSNPSDSQHDNVTPSSTSNAISPTFSVEDAQRILDAVQQAQQPFPSSVVLGTPASAQSDKDW